MFEDSEMVFVLTEGFLFDPQPSFEQPQLLSVNLMRIMNKNFQENQVNLMRISIKKAFRKLQDNNCQFDEDYD